MKKIFILCFLFATLIAKANNVRVTNLSFVNGGAGHMYIQFDLAWDNSWRINTDQSNHDGVWIFFKYKAPTGYWYTVRVGPTHGDNVTPAGCFISQPIGVGAGAFTDKMMGTMIYRSASNTGTGNVSFTGIRLGIADINAFDIEISAFAIEMVFIPNATTFTALGDGDGIQESGNAFHSTDNLASSFDDETTVDANSNDHLGGFNNSTFIISSTDGIFDSSPGTHHFPHFPCGKDFWCMKYEITQGQYRDFLNTLTYTQQTTRTAFVPTSASGTGALVATGTNRNWLEIKSPSLSGAPAVYGCDGNANNIYDETADGEFIACNYLTWPDVAAYLDWSGLCPMTEIHFERACRGPVLAGFGEYAWGTNTIHALHYLPVNRNTENEIVSAYGVLPNLPDTVLGNANYVTTYYNSLIGPFRSGIFAISSGNRVISGAGFYGVMELSGNVIEQVVTIGNDAGRTYFSAAGGNVNPAWGDGNISLQGNALAAYWPGSAPNNSANAIIGEVVNSSGIIFRGGGFNSSSTFLRTASRGGAYGSNIPTRLSTAGGRGVMIPSMYEVQ